jgi:hypothetical protein
MSVGFELRTNAFAMHEEPKLIMSPWVKGKPLHYRCSACSHKFLLREDANPTAGAKDLWAAFTDHVRNEHMINLTS